MSDAVSISRWSTEVEAPQRRLDVYTGVLSALQAPVQLRVQRQAEFEAHIASADLKTIQIVHQKGSPLTCREDRLNQVRADTRNFHLLLCLSSPWDAEHQGTHRCYPGDGMLFDASRPWRISHDSSYEVINIKMSEAWLRQWVPRPALLVGRPFRGCDGWGRALTSFACQLVPDFFAGSPLPCSTVIDHLGALLALSANQLSSPEIHRSTPAARAIAARVADCIQQRYFEPDLTAEQVAESIGISVRTLHRCLATERQSFGKVLVTARSNAALRMMSSPIFRRLTLAEIARRTGFVHASHFSRTMRSRTGQTPSQLRQHLSVGDTPGASDW